MPSFLQFLIKGLLVNTLGKFSPFWQRVQLLLLPFCFLHIITLSEKGVYSKMEDFAPNGSKVFRFRVDPFSEWK